MARQVDPVPSWTLQDAKNRFSAVVEPSERGRLSW